MAGLAFAVVVQARVARDFGMRFVVAFVSAAGTGRSGVGVPGDAGRAGIKGDAGRVCSACMVATGRVCFHCVTSQTGARL